MVNANTSWATVPLDCHSCWSHHLSHHCPNKCSSWPAGFLPHLGWHQDAVGCMTLSTFKSKQKQCWQSEMWSSKFSLPGMHDQCTLTSNNLIFQPICECENKPNAMTTDKCTWTGRTDHQAALSTFSALCWPPLATRQWKNWLSENEKNYKNDEAKWDNENGEEILHDWSHSTHKSMTAS